MSKYTEVIEQLQAHSMSKEEAEAIAYKAFKALDSKRTLERFNRNKNTIGHDGLSNYQRKKNHLAAKITCECGAQIIRSSRSRHIKSDKHAENIKLKASSKPAKPVKPSISLLLKS